MLPPETADLLDAAGQDGTTPARLGAHNLPDEVLIELAGAEGRVIVTGNASDFAAATTCPVLLVRKAWWPSDVIAPKLATALDRWASTNPHPGPWPHWLPIELR